jgi:SAM-dependent methyltransferase
MERGAVERLLDVGCGDGTFLLAAKAAGWEVAGTERNPGPARAEGLDVRESAERFSSSEPFDCITMWHSFEHMPDPLAAISGLSGLLKPGGKLIMAVPDNGGLQAKIFRNGWIHLDVPRHLYHFDAESLRYCLAAAGYSIERRWHQEFEYDLFGWVQSTMNFFFPQPNMFFDFLTGRRGGSVPLICLNVVLGTVLTVLFLPAVPIGTAAGRGGTLIAAARRSVSSER